MVTMRDVADAAGVSIATVSRVLSASRPVDPELAARVRATQAELGYRTNLLASGLRRQRTDTVGMVVPQVANPYFSALMQAVGRRLQSVGRTVLLVDAENDPEVEAHGLHRLLDRSVDGLIAIPVDEHASAPALTDATGRTRLVQLDRAAAEVSAPLVAVDHGVGMRAVVDHLVTLDRRHLTLVGATRRDSTGRERADAFADACDEHGVMRTEPLFGEYSVEWGREAAGRLLEVGEPPSAIVCGNDLIALGILSVLRDADVEVPDQVALTGYDDIGFATLASPALTTVRQPLEALAEAAVGLLLSEPTRGADVHRLAPELVVRGSTDPPIDPHRARAPSVVQP